jgi:hypothetical protein
MDNRYTRYELFSKLRKLNIGAVGTIRDDRSRKGHFEQESKACAGIYKWGTVFFESMGRIVKRKHIANGITRIEKTWEGRDNVAIKLWFDMALVFFMTTIYGIRYDHTPHIPVIMRLCHWPKETSFAPANVVY